LIDGKKDSSDTYAIPREKVRQLECLLRTENIDALLILSREGSDKILPFLIGVNTVNLTAVFFTKEGKHTVIASLPDYRQYLESGIFDSVLPYDKSISEHFLTVFDEINPRRLALNIAERDAISDQLSLGLYRMLEDMIGRNRLQEIEASSEAIIRELRSVKTETEIERLRRAIEITTEIYDEVFGQVRVGMTEREIGDLFVEAMKTRGVCNGLGDPYSHPIVCIVRCGLAHRKPADHPTRPGDILIVDFSVRYQGYVSDISRTAYFLREGETEPPADIQHAFNTACHAITEAINCIGEGKYGWEVDAAARRVIEDGGFPTVRHSVGHPIGIECHDSGTMLAPFRGDESAPCNRKIKCNEVYAIEPTVIQDGGLPCILVEENVLVGPEGSEVLSRRQTGLYLISCEQES